MSAQTTRDPAETTDTERREAQGDRVPFEGIVEVGGALGPSFEAQAVDVSEDGMHLRTAYLPELGQPLTCRLEVGSEVVLAAGEVVWRQEAEKGGDFGLRFTDLDPASESALKKLVTIEPSFGASAEGSKVRLHIQGLGSPMRARVKGSLAEGLVVGSELGFLQVGKELELEDARTGGKRAARIHRVGVEVNPETHIPQLVVSLRYDVTDADAPVATTSAKGGEETTPEPSVLEGRKRMPTLTGLSPNAPDAAMKKEEADEEPFPMRGAVGDAFHKASASMGPALSRFGAQAKTAIALLAARAKKAASKSDEVAIPLRRTTAPPPGGGLHATGRKVVRTEPISAMGTLEGESATPTAKRRLAIGSAVLVAGVLVFAAVHKPSAAPVATTDPAPSASVIVLGASAPPASPVPATPSAPMAALPPAPALAPAPPEDPSPAPHALSTDDTHGHKKPQHVTPFGNGAVGHANVLHLKMDGMIEKIEGATTPTGFTVVIPDRRSLEAAAPLASRDSRIAAIRITNESNGAELAISFKDGVPNYQVRAKGDSLEILLAPQGKLQDLDDAPKATHHRRAQR
jgi:hypothetical protein